MMKKLFFNLLRLYVIVCVYIPMYLSFVYMNDNLEGTAEYYFGTLLVVISAVFAFSSLIYLNYYYKTKKVDN